VQAAVFLLPVPRPGFIAIQNYFATEDQVFLRLHADRMPFRLEK
jgi:hypothetical protein